MSIFSGAISTELPPAQSWMKAQLQAAECRPQLVCSYCTLQVLLNFVSEHKPFCFHAPFRDAVAVACLLSKMRHSPFQAVDERRRICNHFSCVLSQGYSKEFLFSCTCAKGVCFRFLVSG